MGSNHNHFERGQVSLPCSTKTIPMIASGRMIQFAQCTGQAMDQ
jgi:hypothetical protein